MTSTSPNSQKKRKLKEASSPNVKELRPNARVGKLRRLAGAEAGTHSQQRRLEVAHSKISIDGVTYYKCRNCPKALSTSYNYFAHKRIHAREKLLTCKICSKNFTVTSSLTRHVRDVHDKIKDYDCGYCERRLASRIARDEHQRTHTNERPHICETCGKSFRQRASLSVHKRFHSKNFSFRCSQCGRAFPRKQDMERHELTHTDQKPYGCKVCGKSFRSSASAIRHRQSHDSSSKYICDVCGDSFSQERYMKSHKTKMHKDDQITLPKDTLYTFNCRDSTTINKELKLVQSVIYMYGICSEFSNRLQRDCSTFKEYKRAFRATLPAKRSRKKTPSPSKSVKKRSSRSIRKKSMHKVTKMKITSDVHCTSINLESKSSECLSFAEEKFQDLTEAEAEIVNNSAELNQSPEENSKSKKSCRGRNGSGLECRECNKKFRLYNSYQIHMRIHTGEKPYTCHICGKQFGQTGSLYYHLKHVHGGVKNHACDICGRCFAMKTAMEDHRRIHTGERPYICDSCGKSFKTKASLYIHSKIHTNEYPFKCSYCKKLFRWKQQMMNHLTTHTGEKNHMCDICGKGFGVKNELTRHRRTHSLDKPFTCQKCGVSFGQKRYLTNHNRTRHKTKVTSN
ncbi:PREDICTED: endothelial zinc finger protein induced by tumor necrosis factor alpha-like [Ceratosolen solmsi marchali]|uniref:Endothelial zinc finger protein induced by tumor necrosis factor alpha-like n=1 Tax=Ceratosolen solmsi marchali TaxID=326594 RepID=A0AAJ6YUP7_9HYME|nr:PREDICTED: endothelial zinc finger protein induced by tumor necrosis factor alpha-like [Ceratosolen solmsi marchali]